MSVTNAVAPAGGEALFSALHFRLRKHWAEESGRCPELRSVSPSDQGRRPRLGQSPHPEGVKYQSPGSRSAPRVKSAHPKFSQPCKGWISGLTLCNPCRVEKGGTARYPGCAYGDPGLDCATPSALRTMSVLPSAEAYGRV